MRILTAAGFYFGSVFALGFILGLVRTWALSVAPDVSRLQAVLVELPVMLIASWFACGFAVRRFSIPTTFAARASMGVGAFLLLALAELVIATLLRGLTVGEHLRSYAEPSHAIGLAAQVAFAILPLIRIIVR